MRQGLSSGYRVAMAVGNPPFAGFAAVHLGGPGTTGVPDLAWQDPLLPFDHETTAG